MCNKDAFDNLSHLWHNSPKEATAAAPSGATSLTGGKVAKPFSFRLFANGVRFAITPRRSQVVFMAPKDPIPYIFYGDFSTWNP